LCVSVGGGGEAFATNDPTGGTAGWHQAQLSESSIFLTGVSCVTGPLCAAVDQAGEAFVSTDPTLGTASWSTTQIDPDDDLTAPDAVSCPSVRLCVAVDQRGDAIVGTPAPPSSALIRRLLSRELVPARGQVTIRNLLRQHGYQFPFSAPSAGHIEIDWYLTPSRTPGAKRRPKPVLIAAGHHAFTTASDAKIRLALTREGARVLRAAKRVTMTAMDVFTPSGEKSVAASTHFKLSA
jgi:hypothetical protein